MTNPQKALYKMLAESSLRGAHAAKLHESRVQQIPSQQQSMLEEGVPYVLTEHGGTLALVKAIKVA